MSMISVSLCLSDIATELQESVRVKEKLVDLAENQQLH